jgi:hypothetical protein
LGLIALATGLIALAIGATQASATADRADYAAQVDAICAGTSARAQPLVDRHTPKATKRGLALLRRELRSLRRIAPAPGDEALVSSWLSLRSSIQGLVERDIAISRHLQRLEEAFFNGRGHPTRRLKSLFRRVGQMGRTINRLEGRVGRAVDAEAGLSYTLGATDCIGSIGPEDLLEG